MPSKRDKVDHSKPCTLCGTRRDVLIRCQIDETGKWNFVCTGACWKSVSGGIMDGDGHEDHKHYRYGGMWKNKHEAVSAKKPKGIGKRKEQNVDHPESSEEAGASSAHDNDSKSDASVSM